MKKGILGVVLAAGLIGGSALLMGQERGDQEVAAQVVDGITDVSELVGTPGPDPEVGPPDLKAATVTAVLEKLKDPERHGGLLQIARAHGCSLRQVKLIDQERRRRIQELTPDDPVDPQP